MRNDRVIIGYFGAIVNNPTLPGPKKSPGEPGLVPI
jgi:hypothetical protein